MHDNDRLTLSVEEAAQLLGISEPWATSWWPGVSCPVSASAGASWCRGVADRPARGARSGVGMTALFVTAESAPLRRRLGPVAWFVLEVHVRSADDDGVV